MARSRAESLLHIDRNVLTKVDEDELNPLAEAAVGARSLAAAQHYGGNVIWVTLIGPDNTHSVVR